MANAFKPYPGPTILDTITVGAATEPVRVSVTRWAETLPKHCLRLHCETGAFALSVTCVEAEFVALRDLLNAVIADAPAAEAIPVGEVIGAERIAVLDLFDKVIADAPHAVIPVGEAIEYGAQADERVAA